jgi:hypothetical protein
MGKGKAYTAAEVHHLCTAWVATSEDPSLELAKRRMLFGSQLWLHFSAYLEQGKSQEH